MAFPNNWAAERGTQDWRQFKSVNRRLLIQHDISLLQIPKRLVSFLIRIHPGGVRDPFMQRSYIDKFYKTQSKKARYQYQCKKTQSVGTWPQPRIARTGLGIRKHRSDGAVVVDTSGSRANCGRSSHTARLDSQSQNGPTYLSKLHRI